MKENKIEKVTKANSKVIETWVEAKTVGAEELVENDETLALKKTIENLRASVRFRNGCLAVISVLLLAAISSIIVLTVLLRNEKASGPSTEPFPENGEIVFEGIGTPRLTSTILSDQNDFDAQCKAEFGSDARVADWTYDLAKLSDDQVETMTDALGIAETFNTNHYFVSNQGDHYYSGGSRAYFFEKHGGNPPSNWLVHDQLGPITLGSWYDITGPALCITAPTTSPFVQSENRYMSSSNGRIFQLSTTTITETDDFDATCQNEFGDAYRVADYYYDIKASLQESDTADLVTALSMPKGIDQNVYFVNYKGSKFSEDQTDFYVIPLTSGIPRVWFVENHGDDVPNYDWFDKHGKLELGAWFDKSGQALCVSL